MVCFCDFVIKSVRLVVSSGMMLCSFLFVFFLSMTESYKKTIHLGVLIDTVAELFVSLSTTHSVIGNNSGNMMQGIVCSDRILTCRIKSIRSPAKVGLVVTDLITSPVVSWEGWETPPPPSTAALLSFFAQPPAWEDLSLLW